MKTFFNLLLLTAGVFTLWSCSREIQLEKNQHVLGKIEFEGNENVYTETLDDFIPLNQKPNSRPLGLPITPRVWFYNFGLEQFNEAKQRKKLEKQEAMYANLPQDFSANVRIERQKQKLRKKINKSTENINTGIKWFWRNIGEQQTIITESQITETSQKLVKFLHDIGYKDATASYRIDSLKSEKVKVTYVINEGQPYIIDSIRYVVTDRRLDSLIRSNRNSSAIFPGDLFDIRKVEQEKSNLENLAKKHGYYNFLSRYIQHSADNPTHNASDFEREKHGILEIEILNPAPNTPHAYYNLKEIIFKGFDPYQEINTLKPDTSVYNGIKYITLNNRIPINLLDKKLITRPGQLYNIYNIAETQRQIGLLNQFSFASSQLTALNDKEVNLEYFAPMLEKYTLSTGPGINHIYNGGTGFLGFGVPATLTARNLTKRLEIIEAAGRVFFEGQPSPLDANTIRGSLEIGSNFTITYPNITLFGKDFDKLSLKNPRSQFGAGFNYSEPFWGNRLNFKVNSNYSWQPKLYTTIYLSVLDASLVNTNYNLNNEAGRSFYNSLVEQQRLGNNLKVTFDPQFVSSINSSYVYNNQNPQQPYGSSQFLRIFAESGGTAQNFLKNKDRINLIESLFPLRQDFNSPDTVRAYFRYVKLNIDYRRYSNIGPSSSFAYRFNIGATNPYGKNKSLPYEKNFFAGGSNSIRAWSPRSLGVGSALPDTAAGNIIPQPGDILLEGSFEIRKKVARLFGDIQLATFLDFGNVWKWNQIETDAKRDKANFSFDRFYKEFAVGTGFGLRYDLTYFLFRFDWGIKVVDPSKPAGQRFVLDDFSLKKDPNTGTNPYGLQFNLGIGYPF